MSSSEDIFLDTSVSPRMRTSSPMDQSPSSPLMPMGDLTPGSPSPTPPNYSQVSPSPPSPTPPHPVQHSELSDSCLVSSMTEGGSLMTGRGNHVVQIKVEFLDSTGEKVGQSRFCSDSDIIDITSSLMRANEAKYKQMAVSKFCKSMKFKHSIEESVLSHFSQQFSDYISSDICPLKNEKLLTDIEDMNEVNFDSIFDQCIDEENNLMNAICLLCFGVVLEDLQHKKHLKQRLMSIISIAAFSRSQKTNVVQKLLGEYFKLSNTGKQGLQLLQRLGLTLVPKSIRESQDLIGTHFLAEVKERKIDIEIWHERRKVLEFLIKQKGFVKNPSYGQNKLAVWFPEEKFIHEIQDLGEYLAVIKNDEDMEPDIYTLDLIDQAGGVNEALEKHLDLRPKYYDVTFDNLDMGRISSEYLMGQEDQSLHWTSSIVVEDVVDAKEISDAKVERKDSVFEDRIHVTEMENEHLLNNYVQLLMNLVKKNWPHAFPALVETRIRHQYSAEFEREVKVWTGPLVCENESNLEGMAKIITSLTDNLCPATTNRYGDKIPICVTTFSGDQKSEKASRSAQMALMDNGSMRDKLAFVEGRHEMLHFLFMITDVVQDIFTDHENLEESCSLSRLIKLLNPKLESKKGKDSFYAFRDVFSDIFVAQLGEFLCGFLNVPSLSSDVTPPDIKLEQNHSVQMELFRSIFRKFVRQTHHEYERCKEDSPTEASLPPFYPHEKYLRRKKHETSNKERISSEEDVIPAEDNSENSQTKKQTVEVDAKNDYFKALFNFLGSYQLLLDCIKEGNGLSCFLIQKKLLKIVQSTGHKNYSCSILAYKNIVLQHSNPQFSHRYLWNVFCGRAGKSLNFPRDMKNEHLNRYLKQAFRSLGVNLNEKTGRRINNSADAGLEIERKINQFFNIDAGGKSHTKKDREVQIKKLSQLIKKEKITKVVPGRVFKGPTVDKDITNMFDEAKYRAWHRSKEIELLKFEKLRENLFISSK